MSSSGQTNLGGADEHSGAPLVGKRVVAHGLVSNGDINGRRGIALSFDSAAGRYIVRLDKSAKSARLKPANVMKDMTGKRVVVHGLSHKELNGRGGIALSFDPTTSRYVVRLDTDGKKAKLKPTNIRLDATKSLSAATQWYPLEALRSAISDAVDPEVMVEPQVLADARDRLGLLATKALEAVMHRRQVEPLREAVAAAEEAEGLVSAEVIAQAQALVAALEDAPRGAEPASAGTHATNELIKPAHLDDDEVFGHFMHYEDYSAKATVAVKDYKYWGGAEQPWRNGVDDTPVTDQGVIASEEQHKLEAEAKDQQTAGTPDHALLLRCCGVRVDFLLGLTFALNLWGWKTWEVVQYLVKPTTESEGRCRFAELAAVRGYTGAATIFISHCWGARWGDLVAAACTGANTNRIVWIDVFAVRQWPGNGADLDFRGVLEGCTAAIVAAAPIEGLLSQNLSPEEKVRSMMTEVQATYLPGMTLTEVQANSALQAILREVNEDGTPHGSASMLTPYIAEIFRASDEYATAAKVLPFCRLWCVVELHAALERGKPLIFACGKVVGGGTKATRVVVERGEAADSMLTNCAFLVNIEAAEAAVLADKTRELAKIGHANFAFVNRTVSAALVSAANNLSTGSEIGAFVDAFSCGELGSLRALTAASVVELFNLACSAGQLAMLVELQRTHGEAVAAFLSTELGTFAPIFQASSSGRCAVIEWLLGEMGADVEVISPMDGATPLLAAADQGHVESVSALLEAGANVHASSSNGRTALYGAALKGNIEVLRVLLTAGANVDQGRSDGGWTPLISAAEYGHVNILHALIEAGANLDLAAVDGMTALHWAVLKGHLLAVKLLVGAGAGLDHKSLTGDTPLMAAVAASNLEMVKFLESAACFAKTLGIEPDQLAKRVDVGALVDHCGGSVEAALDMYLNDQARCREVAPPKVQGGKPGKVDPRALLLAALKGDLHEVTELLESGASVNHVEDSFGGGATALQLAAIEGHLEVVRVLLGAGAKVEAAANDNSHPLGGAAGSGHLEVVRVLLRAGANVDQVGAGGATSLFMAAHGGHLEVVRELLKAGANKSVRTIRGDTALSIAQQNGHQHVVHELMSERPLAPPSAVPATLTQTVLMERVGRDWVPNVEAAKALVELVVQGAAQGAPSSATSRA